VIGRGERESGEKRQMIDLSSSVDIGKGSVIDDVDETGDDIYP